MDPKLSNPNNQINQSVSDLPQNPTAPQLPDEPVIPVVNPVVQQNPIEPVPVSQAPPQYPIQQPTTLPPVQPLPPIQNTPPPAPVANPISQNQPPTPPPDTNFDGLPKKHLISKKVAAIAVVLFLTVTIPLTVFVTNQQQNIKSGASNQFADGNVIAVFNGENITRDKIQAIAEEQYAPTAVDRQALLDALNTKLERMVLDKEAKDKNIQILESEIQDKMNNDDLPHTEAYYAILREKVTQSQIKSWQVYTIGFWAPPTSDTSIFTDEEKNQRQQILLTGTSMLNEAKNRVGNGESAFSIAKSLLSENTSFQGVLAVNGVQVNSDSETISEVENVKTYNYDSSYANEAFYKTLYSMTINGDIKLNIHSEGNGGEVINLVSFNNSSFNTYADWLAEKENSKILVNPL